MQLIIRFLQLIFYYVNIYSNTFYKLTSSLQTMNLNLRN
jgi:hypothetical protein